MWVQLDRRPLRPLRALDEEETKPLRELRQMVQSLRSLLEEGSLVEAKAKLKELEERVARS